MDIRVIWVKREAEYFYNRGWTGFCPTGKSLRRDDGLSTVASLAMTGEKNKKRRPGLDGVLI
jgi:hypothetical protein